MQPLLVLLLTILANFSTGERLYRCDLVKSIAALPNNHFHKCFTSEKCSHLYYEEEKKLCVNHLCAAEVPKPSEKEVEMLALDKLDIIDSEGQVDVYATLVQWEGCKERFCHYEQRWNIADVTKCMSKAVVLQSLLELRGVN